MIFSKLNGLGNDFVITDDRENKYTENLDEMARKLCHRRTGIGADGLVFVRKSETCDVRMQIFNSDGSEAEMCGNGVRCFAKYVYDKGIFKHERMSVETLAGPMIIDLTVKDGVAVAAKVDMGVPETRREFIPVVGTANASLKSLRRWIRNSPSPQYCSACRTRLCSWIICPRRRKYSSTAP